MYSANMFVLAAGLLVAIPQVVASNVCAQFSASPVPVHQLPNYFPTQKVVNVESLLETEAIRQTLSLYVYVIDARTYDSLSEVFTTDAVANYSAPLGVIKGVEAIKTTLAAGLAQFAGTQHLLGSQSIRLCDPIRAMSVTYFRAAHFLPRNVTEGALDVADYSSILYAYGQYQDSWEKHDGLWKIVYRNLVYMVRVSKC